MSQTDDWLAWLLSKVGIGESPPGSNQTPIGEEFGWNGVAWCAETQSLAALHAFGQKLFWSAAVVVVKQAAINGDNGLEWIDKHGEIRVGDLPCFDFGGRGNPSNFHISGVINPGTQTKFETIGGNEGDRVQRQWRDRTYVMGFVRLPFAEVGLGAPPKQEEEDEVKPARLIAFPDDPALGANRGLVVAFPADGSRPWHVPSNDALALLRITQVVEPGLSATITDAKQQEAVLAMLQA